MSTAIVPTNVKVPAHLAKRLSQPSALAQSLGAGLSGGLGPNYPRISLKGGRFRIIKEGAETLLNLLALDVIIVGANPAVTKTWYAQNWTPDADSNAAPDCYSLDGLKPAKDAKQPQNAICATCPQNAWGSKVNQQTGAPSRACSDHKRLAVVAADAPGGDIYLLQVTPAALKNLNQYHKELSTRGIPPEIVKTRITFDSNASFPKLVFSFADFLSEEVQEQVDKLFGSPEVLEVTGEVTEEAVSVEIAKPVLVKVKPQVIEAEVEEVAPPAPPAVTHGFGAAPAAAPAAKPKRVAKEPEPAAPAIDVLADDIKNLVAGLSFDD